MERLWGRVAAAAAAVAWLSAAGPAARAAFVFGFESPNFTLGEGSPQTTLANRAPDGGGGGFTATFGNGPAFFGGYTLFSVGTLQGAGLPPELERLNRLFDGQYLSLFLPRSNFARLQIDFSTPITELSVAFALLDFQPSGGLRLTSDTGAVATQTATDVGGGLGFPGGTLRATFARPTSSVSLQAIDRFGQSAGFAIDNLTVSPLPAPPAAGLALLGLASFGGLAAARRRLTRA